MIVALEKDRDAKARLHREALEAAHQSRKEAEAKTKQAVHDLKSARLAASEDRALKDELQRQCRALRMEVKSLKDA